MLSNGGEGDNTSAKQDQHEK